MEYCWEGSDEGVENEFSNQQDRHTQTEDQDEGGAEAPRIVSWEIVTKEEWLHGNEGK